MVASVFFLKIYLIFSLMHLYVSVCVHMCIWLHKEAREDTRFSGLRATGGCQLPSEGLGTKLLSSERAASVFNC